MRIWVKEHEPGDGLTAAKLAFQYGNARSEAMTPGDPGTVVQRYKTVMINGQRVTALLDTGSFTSLVNHCWVPVGCLDYSKPGEILCVHGDTHPYTIVDVTVLIDLQHYLLTMGLVDNLPVDAVLGDLPTVFTVYGAVEWK